MRLLYTKFIALVLVAFTVNLQAQSVVNIPSDPVNFVDIFDVIMGDTTATGERTDNNTIYTLDNGGIYITSGRLVNKPEWPLQIQAVDLNDTDNKPVLTRVPNSSGTYPDIMRPEGDVTLRNVWIISGDKGADEQHDWGKIRILGPHTRVIVEDCIIEKDRGGFIQLRADSVKCYINRSVLRNGGNRFILQGNGRGVDARNFVFDSLVVTNSIVHNIIDRVFRSQGGTAAHNYVEFDRNTIFNVAGRHGTFQLRWVNEAIITNNLMINPMMLGTTPAFTEEQIQPDNEAHKIITLDTLPAGTKLTVSNNNIFWTQDVVDVWAKHDSVNQPAILSALVKDALGADTANAYFEEVISLNNVPQNITQYIDDLYANPAATDMFDFVVEDSSVQGTDFDNGNLFKFTEFDPCYAATTMSATAATDSQAIGYAIGCPELATNLFPEINHQLALKVAPNPFAFQASITFDLGESGQARIMIFDVQGRMVEVLADGFFVAGEQQVEWRPNANQSQGLYFVRLETENGFMTKKLLKQ